MKTRFAPRVLSNTYRAFSLSHSGLAALAASLALCSASMHAGEPGAADRLSQQMLADARFHGGLVVQVGCRDAGPLLSFAQSPNVLAQGLVSEPERLAKVRGQIDEAGLYGRVSAVPWNGEVLPYADGMVNLLLAFDEVELDQDEIDRVLVPLGVAWVRRGNEVTSYQKPWPEDVDQWSHSRYDATGNAVSRDQRVGPPRFLQWEATPRWNRSVKTSALVSTQGRLFYILDDSHFAARTHTWSLIARDAGNGIQLWRHELASWGGSHGGKKVGPAQMHRRLVADNNRVYVTLAEFAPVSVLDAATGEVLRTLDGTEPAEELILSDGILVVMASGAKPADIRRGKLPSERLLAIDAQTGKRLWKHDTATILPMTLASDGDQVVYHDGQCIQSVDLRTGGPRWTSSPTGQKIVFRDQANPDSPGSEKSTIVLAPQFAPTLIIYDGVVAFAGGRQLNVVSAADGKELWQSDYAASNYSVPVDLFGFGGCLWGPDAAMNLWRPLSDDLEFKAYDPLTGEVERSVSGSYRFRFQHHRCHQMKVVGDTVLAARAGIEFVNTATGTVTTQHWTRGSCYYGVLPANGRLYVPPHDCACYIRAKLSGFLAMNSEPPTRSVEISEDARLRRGPAFGQPVEKKAAAEIDDWPTYRHDMARSGRTASRIGSELLLGWQNTIGGRLTAPVIAGGRAYVASTDAHTLYALDADTGEPVWQATFDARIDSPPTVYEGLALCGCRDGSVHALRAADGVEAWRFLAAPARRQIVSRGQLESVWPVSGNILVTNGVAYFAAGRSSYLDGGIHFYGLDPHTGRKVVDSVLSSRHPDGSEFLDDQGVDGYLNDVLSTDGERIFMRHQALDRRGMPKAGRTPHLHTPDGFLSSDTTNRLLWTYAPVYTSPHQGAFYDQRLNRVLFPSGRILVVNDDTVFGYGQNFFEEPNADPGGRWALFAVDKENDVPLDLSAIEYRKLALAGKKSVHFRWWKELPIQVRAMVLTDDVLFVAGPLGSPLTTQAALDGETPASLLAVSPDDGSVLAEMTLPSTPVWDGMAVAGGNLYVALADGDIACLWSLDSGRPGRPLSAAAWKAMLPPIETSPEPGLVGRWRFNEGEGLLARDCSGQKHDAVVSGVWAKDESGTCLVSDGVAGAAVIPDAPHLQFGADDFTLAMWVRVDSNDVRLVGKEAFPENWWVINVLDNGRAELVLGEGRGPGHSTRATTTRPIAVDAWNHLVAVVDRQAGEIRWYLDGKPDSRHPIPETMTKGLDAAGQDITIPCSHKPFHGLIGDFRIYRRAISSDDVKKLNEEHAPRRPEKTG